MLDKIDCTRRRERGIGRVPDAHQHMGQRSASISQRGRLLNEKSAALQLGRAQEAPVCLVVIRAKPER
jgi:hypothetical protein